jgi:hypothetical protein
VTRTPKRWPIPQFDLETGAIVWEYPGNHRRVSEPPVGIPDRYRSMAEVMRALDEAKP